MQFYQRKETSKSYIDSLVFAWLNWGHYNFKASERELINKRIEEMEQEEKQTQAKIYKQDFELTQQQEDKIDLTHLKKTFINFKSDHPQATPKETRNFIIEYIENIYYHHNQLTLKFRSLPWTLDFTT